MTRPSIARYDSYKGPQSLEELWTLTQGALTMHCTLKTHRLGWEMKLIAGKNTVRTQICRSETEVFTTADAWQAEAIAKGWA